MPQGVLQGNLIGLRINIHLTLGHNATAMIVGELNRILYGNYVPVAVLITILQHTGQGCGFARACSTYEHHQSALDHCQIFYG